MDLFAPPGLSELQEAVEEYNQVRTCADKGTLCHAPERSMYFARDGSVLACCYSRHEPIGRYPEQSLQEIWNGAQVNSVRTSLRQNELPSGCEICYSQLIAGNYSGLLARTFDHFADRINLDSLNNNGRPYPSKLEFELSNTCNLECAMCTGDFSSTIRLNREKLPALTQVYDDAFIDQLRPLLPHLKTASFVGGEPFLIDIYYQIWDLIIEINPTCEISITTNGTVYNSRVKRVLEKLTCQINISLDSISKPSYEAIRVNAKLERTLANLDAFMEVNRRNNKSLNIMVCPMVSNCREMPDLISFANERGLRVFFNTVFKPFEQSIRSMSIEAMHDLVRLYRAQTTRSDIVAKANRDALEDLAAQVELWAKTASIEREQQLQKEAEVAWERERLEAELARERDRLEAEEQIRADTAQREADRIAAALQKLRIGSTTRGDDHDVQRRYTWLIDEIHNSIGGTRSFARPEPLNPLNELQTCYRAIWYLGADLSREGVLEDSNFDPQTLDILLNFMTTSVREPDALRMITAIQMFPLANLQYIGSSSPQELIAATRQFLDSTE